MEWLVAKRRNKPGLIGGSVLLLLPVILFAQQRVLDENFDGIWSTTNPPAGWEITFWGDTSANDWHRAPDLGFNPWPDNPSPYAALGIGNDEEIDDWMISPYLDLTGCQNVVLSCSLGIVPGTGISDVKIYGAVDSGPFTIEIANLTGQTVEPGLFTYNLDWAQNRTGVRIAFVCFGEPSAITYFVVDNVSITARRRATDVGVLRILAPRDTVDSAQIITPSCRVYNPSLGTGSFWTYCQIGNYRDSGFVNELNPGESTAVSFRSWSADTAGIIYARFWTALPGDLNPVNDTASQRVFVKPPFYNDAAALEILAPVGTVLETTTVIPQGVIANNTSNPVELKAYFEISFFGSPLYVDSLTTQLPPRQVDTVSFSPWVATPPGTFNTTLWVVAPRDLDPENDRVSSTVTVRAPAHDVGAIRILAPFDTNPPGPVSPRAEIVNFGTFVEGNFKTIFTILQSGTIIYRDSTTVSTLSPGETALISFANWDAQRGNYTVACSTCLPDDNDPTNDRYQKTVVVRTPILPGWQELTPVPQSPSNKPLKDGTALTYLQNRVYLLRGNKTDDFLCYDVDADTWLELKKIPSPAGKAVYRGGDLCTDGSRYIYATKGYSSVDFFRYDFLLDSWERKNEIPLGPTRKPIKGGNKMVFVSLRDGDYIYLLKGHKNEFWRYNVRADSWEQLTDAPAGASGKDMYKDGSFLVYDGTGRLFAVKAKYGEIFAFDLHTSRWLNTSYRNFPEAGMLGKKKKVKAGAAGTWWNGRMFCLKGGSTCEFWCFFPDSGPAGRWQELETIPQIGATQKKKRVKAGGGIVGTGTGIFFAVKGNKTYEFWCYKSPEAGPGVEEKPQPAKVSPAPQIKLYPNPAKDLIHIQLNRQVAGKALITVYDATGRERYRFITHSSQFTVNCGNWAPGVYLIRVQTGTVQTNAKIIVH